MLKSDSVSGLPLHGGFYVGTHALVVEDAPGPEELVRFHLESAGHRTTVAESLAHAADILERSPPDIVMLDDEVRGASSLEWTRQLRGRAATVDLPIIMLSGRADEAQRVEALEAAVDDFIDKPFSPRELIARMAAVLRRRQPCLFVPRLEIDGLALDHAARTLAVKGRPVHLGPTEFRLLQYLLTHPDELHARRRLVHVLWPAGEGVEERTVDVYVGRLREALRPCGYAGLIETVRGGGYRVGRCLTQ